MNTPPLIALPGTLLDGRSLDALLSGLQVETRVLGEAEALDEEVDRLAAQTAVPAVWLGHSLGGIVALRLAQRHPGKVAALVLLASNARAGRDTSEARRSEQWALAQHEGLNALARNVLAPAYGLTAGRDSDEALVASMAAQAEAVGLRRFEHQLNYARLRPGLLAPLHRLTCPLLALSGELDTLCPPAQSDELVALVQPPGRAAHHMLGRGWHLFPMQQADTVARHLRSFLTSLEESVR